MRDPKPGRHLGYITTNEVVVVVAVVDDGDGGGTHFSTKTIVPLPSFFLSVCAW
jgi:hypothetical protein